MSLDTPRTSGSVHSWARRAQEALRFLSLIRGDQRNITVSGHGRGILIRFIGFLFPFSPKVCLGLKIKKNQVTIYGGEIQVGENAAIAVADATLTINTDDDKVGWEYNENVSPPTLTLKNFGSSVSHENGKIKKWLYEFVLIDGRAYVQRYGLLNPTIPANWGGPRS